MKPPTSPEPNDLLLFARVADEGSFSRAGERLGLPKSTVSRRIATLEAQLGERLLLRTTRKLSLTDFGHSVLAHAHQVVQEVEAATALAQHRQVEPSGRLRVSMPGDFANVVLGGLIAEFIARYPAISLELDLSPRRVDLIGENYDLAVRMGELSDDATLAARRLATFSGGLYASPAYLKQHGRPTEPAELTRHQGLQLAPRAGEPKPWLLTRQAADGRVDTWEGHAQERARANSPDLLIRLACAGVGLCPVADHFAEPYVRSGELVPVLPDWSLPSAPAWAVFPGRRLMPARTRVFLDALEAEFAAPNCQVSIARIQRTKMGALGPG
jgi:DNA-binding transcriptional LysR family regulator